MAKTDSPDEADKEASRKETKEEKEDEITPEIEKKRRSSSRKKEDKTDNKEETSSPASKEEQQEEDQEMKDDTEGSNENEEDEDEEVAAANKGKNKKTKSTKSKKRKGSPSLRDRRERKAVKSYSPVETKPVEKPHVTVEQGRGVRLSELDHVKEAIQAAALDDLLMGYKFLFWRGRGKLPKISKKDLKQSILAFSGYLPMRDPKLSKAKQAEVDEEYEVKMGQKAYKLMVHQLKKLCDTFGIDRRGMSGNKEDLVNCLLDFMGEPVTMEKFEKIRSTSTASKKKKKEEDQEKTTDDTEEQGDLTNDDYWEDAMLPDGAQVSDETLRLWVRAFVRCHNIKTTTLKQTVAIATEKFGVDMTDKTLQIKELLVEEA